MTTKIIIATTLITNYRAVQLVHEIDRDDKHPVDKLQLSVAGNSLNHLMSGGVNPDEGLINVLVSPLHQEDVDFAAAVYKKVYELVGDTNPDQQATPTFAVPVAS